jgi:hypothetical protein
LIATACLLIAIDLAAGGLQDVVQDPVSADFFVSPRGKDTWAGKQADPGEDDRPFATVARARRLNAVVCGVRDVRLSE